MDLGLPGMPGDAVAARLKVIDPKIVTVLVTGWELAENDPRFDPFDFFLKKPYQLSQIQEMVLSAIAQRYQAK